MGTSSVHLAPAVASSYARRHSTLIHCTTPTQQRDRRTAPCRCRTNKTAPCDINNALSSVPHTTAPETAFDASQNPTAQTNHNAFVPPWRMRHLNPTVTITTTKFFGRCLCCSTTHRCQQSQQPHTTRLTMPHHAACRPSSRPLCFTALLLSLFSACVTEIPLVSLPARFLPFLPWGGGSTRPVDRDTLRWQLQPPSLSLLHLQPFMPLRHRQQRPQAKSIPHVPARLCTACCSVYHHRHAALVHRRSHQPAAATYAELVPAVG